MPAAARARSSSQITTRRAFALILKEQGRAVGNDKSNEAPVKHRIEIAGELSGEPRPQGGARRCRWRGPRLEGLGPTARRCKGGQGRRCDQLRRDIVIVSPPSARSREAHDEPSISRLRMRKYESGVGG